MNNMKYRGYDVRIEYDDDDDGIFFGRITGIRDGVSFTQTPWLTSRTAFREALDDYLETSPRNLFGQPLLRVDPAVHAKAALAAEIAEMSLNQWERKSWPKRPSLLLEIGELSTDSGPCKPCNGASGG
jgi:predicted HicB family RNase H-like nuclease